MLPKEVKEAGLKPAAAPVDVTGQLKATVGELRQLAHKKPALQKKVDQAKDSYKTLLDELKSVQEAIDREHKQLGTQSEAYAHSTNDCTKSKKEVSNNFCPWGLTMFIDMTYL